ncbi:hypothetical protein [Arthrobacter sp. 260]|uniref:hypothetical protein n=1 Tax=Arthrobacter sp. 260 TaxID=2735314 RepID=UPI0014930D6E|nr:hypothetical protein [Arthrobacter sp. 260]NOJ59332.1 hypothetical protein [Arthrobacter sp. 260]
MAHTGSSLPSFFTNARGEQTIAQAPNAPVLGWTLFGLASRMALREENRVLLRTLSRVCLCLWAVLELTRGESGFRRTMGGLTLGWLATR